MSEDVDSRRYFTVLDLSGRAAPAVEYWAGAPDEDTPAYTVVPLRKFVRIVGSGERLEQLEESVFLGLESRQKYFRVST